MPRVVQEPTGLKGVRATREPEECVVSADKPDQRVNRVKPVTQAESASNTPKVYRVHPVTTGLTAHREPTVLLELLDNPVVRATKDRMDLPVLPENLE